MTSGMQKMAEGADIQQARLEGVAQGRVIAKQDDFMTVYIESAHGSLELLDVAMEAADQAAEETYSSNPRHPVGRMFISGGKRTLAIACFVPPPMRQKAPASEWLQAVLAATGGEASAAAGDASGYAKAMITEGEGGGFKTPKGQSFSLAETLGFEATRASVEWLRSLGLFPPKAEVGDEDDEYIPEGDW